MLAAPAEILAQFLIRTVFSLGRLVFVLGDGRDTHIVTHSFCGYRRYNYELSAAIDDRLIGGGIPVTLPRLRDLFSNSAHSRFAAATERAQTLAQETERLIARTRGLVHATRNTRHHAALLRMLLKLRRART